MGLLSHVRWLVASPRVRVSKRSKYGRERARARALLRKPPKRSAWTHVQWREIRRRAITLINQPNALDQAALHLCGSACVLDGLVSREPLRFAKLVRSIYARGAVGELEVSKRLLQAKPSGAHPLDWMLLSAVRNAYGRPRFVGQTGFTVSAINLPGDVKRWAAELGGFRAVRSHTSYLRSGTRHIGRINKALRDGAQVFALMRMKSMRAAQGHDLHWVRLLAPVVDAGDGQLRLKVFDRGRALRAKLSRRAFGKSLLHTIIAEP